MLLRELAVLLLELAVLLLGCLVGHMLDRLSFGVGSFEDLFVGLLVGLSGSCGSLVSACLFVIFVI